MKVVLRADASSRIGIGHVMRGLALGRALVAGGHAVTLATAELPDPLAERAAAHGIAIRRLPDAIDAEALVDAAHRASADWAIIDHYELGPAHASALRSIGVRVLVVDDLAAWPTYPAELVLNQNAYADRTEYAGRTAGRLLVGARFAVLRPEFAAYADWRRPDPALADLTVLVTLGGTDPGELTGPLTRAVHEARGVGQVLVAIGASNPNAAALRDALGGIAGVEPQFDPDLPALMAEADLAVASAGSTSWELAFMQVPAVVVVSADNQERVAASLARHGVAVSLGRGEELAPREAREAVEALAADAPRRAAMASAGRDLVDGRGAARVVRAMEQAGLTVRPATDRDAELLFRWANDPVTRAASFDPAPIAWDTHLAWLERSLGSAGRLLLVAEAAGDAEPIGQVRFDRESEEVAVISVSVAPEARGRGAAAAIIDAGVRAVRERWGIRRVRAEIRSANRASLAAFADAGFTRPVPLEGRADAVAMWIEEDR